MLLARSDSSLFLFAFALLLFLFLGEGVHHEELAVSWIPFGSEVGLVLVWHEDGPLQRLHVRYVYVGLVLLVAWVLGSRQIVSYRHYLFHLRLPSAVNRILRHKVELFAEGEVWQAGNPLDLFDFGRDDLTVLVFLLGGRLPPGQLFDQILGCVGGLRPS